MHNATISCDEYEAEREGGRGRGHFLVEKEMGIHRRKRRSIHGKEFYPRISPPAFSGLCPTSIYASCLDIRDESVLDTILEGCTNVEEMIKKLKEQTISLTKKRCIKTKLTPVEQSKVVRLSFIKKIKYRAGISSSKLKVGFRNFLYTFELWYSSLKVIEGKFGSSVATYFKFLRKLFILNCIIFLLNFFFIILPQVLYVQFSSINMPDTNVNSISMDTKNSYENMDNVTGSSFQEALFFFFPSYPYSHDKKIRLGNLFTGMGYLTDSVLFYGHYYNSSFTLTNGYAYDIPSAYFFSTAFCYFLVLCVLFFSVAESYKKCYIETSNGVKNVFAEKIFCGWDFGIAKRDAEELKYCTIYMELKELLNESGRRNKKKNFFDCFYTMMIRVSLNMIILLLLIALGWYTSTYLDLHMDSADIPTIMMLMLILTLVTTLAPVGFSWLAKFEYYECPRTALYVTIIRTFILHILIIIMIVAHRLNSASKMACWETVVGQDIYKLVVLDFIIGVGDSMIGFIKSRMNKKWNMIDRPEFNIALSTMNLIYNQALLYIGLYFSPALSLIVSFKMLLTFYLKKWGAMYNCQPFKRPWRAAQMQTVFLSFAFFVFFGVIMAYGYIFSSVKTSSCGPFGGGKLVFEAVLYEILHDGVNSTAVLLLSHFLRSGVSVILLLVMILAIYYLRSVNSVRRRIVKNLRHIIKEQATHKRRLIMKINKAQEDFKNDVKKGSEDRKNKLQRTTSPTMVHVHDGEEISSDSDENGEDKPLKCSFEKVGVLRTRLSRSYCHLNIIDKCQENKSRNNIVPSISLQDLNRDPYPLDFNANTEIFRLKDQSEVMGCVTEQPLIPAEEEIANRDILIPSDQSAKEIPRTPRSRGPYSYDERVPSRIYFGRKKK